MNVSKLEPDHLHPAQWSIAEDEVPGFHQLDGLLTLPPVKHVAALDPDALQHDKGVRDFDVAEDEAHQGRPPVGPQGAQARQEVFGGRRLRWHKVNVPVRALAPGRRLDRRRVPVRVPRQLHGEEPARGPEGVGHLGQHLLVAPTSDDLCAERERGRHRGAPKGARGGGDDHAVPRPDVDLQQAPQRHTDRADVAEVRRAVLQGVAEQVLVQRPNSLQRHFGVFREGALVPGVLELGDAAHVPGQDAVVRIVPGRGPKVVHDQLARLQGRRVGADAVDPADGCEPRREGRAQGSDAHVASVHSLGVWGECRGEDLDDGGSQVGFRDRDGLQHHGLSDCLEDDCRMGFGGHVRLCKTL